MYTLFIVLIRITILYKVSLSVTKPEKKYIETFKSFDSENIIIIKTNSLKSIRWVSQNRV